MAALTADYYNTASLETADYVTYATVAAGKTIYAGAIVSLDAAGDAVPGGDGTEVTAIGRARMPAAAGETVEIEHGVFRWENDGANTVDATHIGVAFAKVVDDQTVDNGGGTGLVLGKIVLLEGGVFVDTRERG